MVVLELVQQIPRSSRRTSLRGLEVTDDDSKALTAKLHCLITFSCTASIMDVLTKLV